MIGPGMDIDISVAFPGTARVAEGPFWDQDAGRLSWVDILSGAIHTGTSTITLPTLVGAAVPKTSGGFVAATTEGFTEVGPAGTWTTRVAILPPGQRMNDAKCDAAGRLWAGSTDLAFAPGEGALHVLGADWRAEQVLTGLTLPNGLDWSPDARTFYLIDSIAGELNAFDVQPDRPGLANRRLVASFPQDGGLADGMTVDAGGALWIAMWGGHRVIRLSPDGDVLTEVAMPVAQPSSCAFGGPDLDVLYVTTAREGLSVEPGDVAGSVLAVTGLGVRGLPARPFRG
jgi:sugar lactone lactonase YvrE